MIRNGLGVVPDRRRVSGYSGARLLSWKHLQPRSSIAASETTELRLDDVEGPVRLDRSHDFEADGSRGQVRELKPGRVHFLVGEDDRKIGHSRAHEILAVGDATECEFELTIFGLAATFEDAMNRASGPSAFDDMRPKSLHAECQSELVGVRWIAVTQSQLPFVDDGGDDRHRRAGYDGVEISHERVAATLVLEKFERNNLLAHFPFMQDDHVVPEPFQLEGLQRRNDDADVVGLLEDAEGQNENRIIGIDHSEVVCPAFVDVNDNVAEDRRP